MGPPDRVEGVFRNPAFRLYWLGNSISQVGSRVTTVALPLVAVLELDASVAQVGLLQAVVFLPYLLVSMPAGLLADRVRRRPLMIGADLGRAALLALVPLGMVAGWLDMSVLVAVAFTVGALTVLFDVCYLSALPWLVGREQLMPANAALEVSRSVAQVAGPGLAGVLVAAVKASGAVVATVVSYLVSAAALAAIRRPEPAVQADEESGRLSALMAGWTQVLRSPLLRPQAAHLLVGNVVFGAYQAILVVFMVRGLGLSGFAVGVTLGIANLGVIVGAMVSSQIGRRIGLGRLVILATVLEAAGLAVVAAAPASDAVPVLVPGQALAGFAIALFNLQSLTLRQTVTPPALLARVNAVVRLLSFGVIPLGAAAGGWLAEEVGIRQVLVALVLMKLASVLIPLTTALGRIVETPDTEPVWR
ncbi:MFS transporter [Ornithinimicrobium murale]|uniref:MFS transporter n=1 Tax=Ornithinimicrobium murale TaxID=1050153 RepID=UPI000E0D8BE3|nr:MFS transporter [Ornithinimicrobium murale]